MATIEQAVEEKPRVSTVFAFITWNVRILRVYPIFGSTGHFPQIPRGMDALSNSFSFEYLGPATASLWERSQSAYEWFDLESEMQLVD